MPEPKTLPNLQKKLNYIGSDETFKQYVLSALNNRGPVYSKAFKMYYGIDCKKCSPEEITEELSVYDVHGLKRMVMKCIEKEIKSMLEEQN